MFIYLILRWAYPYDLIVGLCLLSLAACWPEPDPEDGKLRRVIPK